MVDPILLWSGVIVLTILGQVPLALLLCIAGTIFYRR